MAQRYYCERCGEELSNEDVNDICMVCEEKA